MHLLVIEMYVCVKGMKCSFVFIVTSLNLLIINNQNIFSNDL